MRVSNERATVSHEVEFQVPVFRLADSTARILESLYAALAPRYPIAPANLHVTSGSTLADVGLRIDLFNGNGVLEVRASRFVAEFRGVRSADDLRVVKECLLLCHAAFRSALPEVVTKSSLLRYSSWLRCDGGREAALQLTGGLVHPDRIFPASFLDSTEVDYALRGQLRNDSDRWAAAFVLEISRLPEAHLFFLCETSYVPGAKYDALEEQVRHAEAASTRLMSHLGLDLS